MLFGVPIEYLMFGGIGFCLAWLMALIILPAVHNRATRLARERYDDLPLSMQEMRAEKDTIRAGFAAATRDLEVQLERLRGKTAAHATDVAKKAQLVDRLKQEVDTVTAALRDSEAREQTARDALREAKRGFADRDVTLGTAEDEIAVLKRDLAAKDARLRSAESDLAALRHQLADKASALRAAESEIASKNETLRDSAQREESVRADLRETRNAARQVATLGAAEDGQAATLGREIAARDAALRATERDLEAARAEIATKDAALTRAEKEIAAIKAEIAALTTLLVGMGRQETPAGSMAESAPVVDIVPLTAASRPVAHAPVDRKPGPAETAAVATPVLAPVAESAAAHHGSEQQRPRAPIDLVAAPTRLIPPTIPQGHDNVSRAAQEIADAARRVDQHDAGPNQRLRAAYAPLVKG
jgi:predicted  nucleic acid-binding Zn-ribbon protein